MQTPNSPFTNPRTLVLIGLVVAAALSRVVPHPPNFSPLEATALFAGAFFVDRRLGILVPIAAMLLSDIGLALLKGVDYGFHSGMPVVYGCMALIAVFGRGLAGRASVARVGGYALASAVFFYLVTNLATWATSGMYPMTASGLVTSYVAAIPFFGNTLAGVAFYSIVLFGGFALLARQVPALRPAQAA